MLRLLRIALLIVLTWACLGLFFASQNSVIARENGDVEEAGALISMAFAVISWSLLSPFVLYLAERLPPRRPNLLRNLVLLAIVCVLFAAVRALMDGLATDFFEAPMSWDEYRLLAAATFQLHLLLFLGMVALANLWWSRAEADERRSARPSWRPPSPRRGCGASGPTSIPTSSSTP